LGKAEERYLDKISEGVKKGVAGPEEGWKEGKGE
jgi:hypothetical protein